MSSTDRSTDKTVSHTWTEETLSQSSTRKLIEALSCSSSFSLVQSATIRQNQTQNFKGRVQK